MRGFAEKGIPTLATHCGVLSMFGIYSGASGAPTYGTPTDPNYKDS